MGKMIQFGRVAKPEIHVTQRASREAIDTQLDLEKMLAAAVYEQARFFSSISDRVLAQAMFAFRSRFIHLFSIPDMNAELQTHIGRTAEIFAATRLLGRVRIRKEVGMPVPVQQTQFGEVLAGVGVNRAVDYLAGLKATTAAEWKRLIDGAKQQAFAASGVESKAASEALLNLLAKALRADWSEQQFETAATQLLKTFESEAGSLRTLWNTTTANAMAKGRAEELNDPAVKAVVAFRLYDAILDARTRPNHAACDGGIADADWDGWIEFTPPLGFNCRCTVIGITSSRAKAMIASGRGFDFAQDIPAGAGPDPGFREAA